MKYEINIKIGNLEGRTEFLTYTEYDFMTMFGYLSAMLIGDNFKDLTKLEVRKVDELNESNNV